MNVITTKTWQIYQHALRTFILRRVKDKAVTDDIMQDVFLKVHNNLSQLKDLNKLSAWIYQITRNTIADYFRKESKTIAQENLNWDSDTNILNECVAICLRQLVDSLPDKYKEAFLLAEIEDLSQLELSKRLGISYSGAKSRVQRARILLKKKMEELLIIKTDSYGNIIVCEDRNPCCCQ